MGKMNDIKCRDKTKSMRTCKKRDDNLGKTTTHAIRVIHF